MKKASFISYLYIYYQKSTTFAAVLRLRNIINYK